MYKYELSIVIPCYNEEENLEGLFLGLTKELNSRKVNYELILVDNGSKDNTQQIIRRLMRGNPRIKLLIVKRNQGYGWGVTRGLERAEGRYVGFLDGDNQVSPAAIFSVFDKIRKEGLDLCKARRIEREDGLKRRLLSLGYDIALSLAFLRQIRDTNAKPKLMTRECYRSLGITSKDWFIDSEIMIKAIRKGYKAGEFRAHFAKRRHGKSNVSFGTIGEFLKNVIKIKLNNSYGR